jgi:hypothetical protein
MKKTSEPQLNAQHRLRRIEGRHNPLVKELRQAFAHGERTEEGDCAIDGLRIVEEAIRSGLRLRAVFFANRRRTVRSACCRRSAAM